MWDLKPLTTWPRDVGPSAVSTRERWALLALVAIACALRLVQVTFSFDTDEVFSVQLARRPFAQLVDGALWDRSHPPLHVLLETPLARHNWLSAASNPQAALQLTDLGAMN